MNTQTIEHALDPDLRLSQQALQRAALRARELAQQTGTSIVICRNGVVEHLPPQQGITSQPVPELPAADGNEQQ